MKWLSLSVIKIILLIIVVPVWAQTNFTWYENKVNVMQVNAYLFLSSSCKNCTTMQSYLQQYALNHPWLNIHYQFVDKKPKDLALFNTFLKQKKENDFIVPSLYFCNSRWVGVADTQVLGEAMTYCYEHLIKEKRLSSATQKVLQNRASAYLFKLQLLQQDRIANPTPLLILSEILTSIPLIFSLLCLLIWSSGIHKKILGVYLLSAGCMHYFHQVYLESFYFVFPYLRPLSVLLGLSILLFILLKKRTEIRKHNNLFLFGFALLMPLILVAYQQIQQPNMGLVFQQWIVQQGYIPSQIIFYEILYQICYILLLGAFALALWSVINKIKSLHALQSYFILFSHLFFMVLGIIFLFAPSVLAHFSWIMGITFLTSLCSRLIIKFF